MSFNSPFGGPVEKPETNSFPPASNPNYETGNQPAAPETPSYGSAPAIQPTGKTNTFTIVSFILAIFFPLLGLILSIVAFKQTKATGDNSGLAKAGIVVGAILMALSIISSFVMFGVVTSSIENGTLVTVS